MYIPQTSIPDDDDAEGSLCTSFFARARFPLSFVSRRFHKMPTATERELLARHVVIATFTGIEPGREPMLRIFPPQPAKNWAAFKIDEYLEFEKPGKYGDDKTDKFAFLPDDADAAIAATLNTLQPGDRVKLSWHHDYVTRTEEGGGQSKSPERPVQLLERIEAGSTQSES